MPKGKLTLNDIMDAFEEYGDTLKREIENNENAIENADQVVESIDSYFEQLPKFFELVREPTARIQWDPEAGNPYVVVSAWVRLEGDDVQSIMDTNVKMFDYLKHHHHMVVLDLTPIRKGEEC